MPSILIHVAISKIANESLKLNEKEFIIGSIIPDFDAKENTHYYEYSSNGLLVPNADRFLRDQSQLSDLVLGQLSHLIADREFFGSFINRFIKYNKETFEITTKDMQVLKGKEAHLQLEQDYDILNNKLVQVFKLKPLSLDSKYSKEINAYNNYLLSKNNQSLTILSEEEVINFINETSLKVKNKIKRIGEKHE